MSAPLSLSLLGVTTICYSHFKGSLMEIFFLLCLLPLHIHTSHGPHSQQSGKHYYNLNASYELSTWWTPLILTQPYRLSSSFSIWGNWGWESKQKPCSTSALHNWNSQFNPWGCHSSPPSGLEIKGRVSDCRGGAGHSLHHPSLKSAKNTMKIFSGPCWESSLRSTNQPHLPRRPSTQNKKPRPLGLSATFSWRSSTPPSKPKVYRPILSPEQWKWPSVFFLLCLPWFSPCREVAQLQRKASSWTLSEEIKFELWTLHMCNNKIKNREDR